MSDMTPRTDTQTSKRIESIWDHVHQLVVKGIVVIFIFGILCVIGAVAQGLTILSIQHQRRDNSYKSCLRSNKQNLAIIDTFHVSPKDRTRFPIISDCHAYARKATK